MRARFRTVKSRCHGAFTDRSRFVWMIAARARRSDTLSSTMATCGTRVAALAHWWCNQRDSG